MEVHRTNGGSKMNGVRSQETIIKTTVQNGNTVTNNGQHNNESTSMEQNRFKNTSSSIFDGVMAPPVENSRRRGGYNRADNSSQFVVGDDKPDAPITNNGNVNTNIQSNIQSNGSSRGHYSPNKNDYKNPLTGEGYGPKDYMGIGALRQHSNVPPGGFCSDFWKNP